MTVDSVSAISSHMHEISFPKTLSLNEVECAIDRVQSDDHYESIIDLSKVEWVDVAGILLFLVWLRQLVLLKKKIKLVLPEAQRVSDFLKAWNFEPALCHALKADIISVVDESQYDYFTKLQEFYTDKDIEKEYGDLKILRAHDLLSIVPLTVPSENGNECVSKAEINEIADKLALRSVVPVLESSISNCDRSWAERFGKVLVYQALLNAFEHPDANMAYMAIAKKSKPPNSLTGSRLVIAVVDNGRTISDTIGQAYEADPRTDDKVSVSTCENEQNFELVSNRIVYATLQNTSRKTIDKKTLELPPEERPGMGLFYLKRLTEKVNGEVIIRCLNASVKFRSHVDDSKKSPDPREVPWLDSGNLIRISIPLAN